MISNVVNHNTLFPASYIELLMQLVQEQGVDVNALLPHYQLTRQQIQEPLFQMPLGTAAYLTGMCIKLCPDSELGFLYGQRIHLASHGDLGMAVLSSSTYQQNLELMIRYSQTRIPYFKAQYKEQGEKVVIDFKEVLDLGPNKLFCYETMLSSQFTISQFLLGDLSEQVTLCLSYPQPPHAHLYEKWLTPNLQFNAEANEIIFPKKWLTKKLAMSSQPTHELAVSRLNQISNNATYSLYETVQNLISQNLSKGITLEQVAGELNMSSRTLIRKLSQQQASFKGLLLEARQKKARYLLSSTGLFLEEISDLLGYKDPANFTRAFNQWQGMTPSEFRHQQFKQQT